MAEVKFYLEKRKDKETGKVISSNVPIFLYYSFNGQRLQYFTGERIDAYKWDEGAMKVKKGFEEASETNKNLGKLKTKVEEAYDRAKVLNEEISISYFKNYLNDNQLVNKRNKNFAECLAQYIEVSALTKTAGTLRAINCSFKTIKKFAHAKHIALDFKTINQDFYDGLLDFCFNTENFKNNYTGKIIKDLKAFLNWATDKGYNTTFEYKKRSFKNLSEEPEIFYLTYEELMTLYKYNLKGNARLDQVRDVFCFGCFSGMRYSDILALKPEHIQKDSINFRTQKTTEGNVVPLNKFTKRLIAKYKGVFDNKCLPVISEQNTNEYLKELLALVGLNRKVQKVSFQGAKRLDYTAPLSEIITFHISKKTFMTNFLAKGGSLLTAMAITGNKDHRAARRYYKVVDTLKSNEMAKVFGK